METDRMSARGSGDAAREARTDPEILFYDGDCGLCHRAVLFVLHRDPAGRLFHYAPLNGETAERMFTADERERLPDSIIVKKSDGSILLRSEAALYLLRRIGGAWAALGRTGMLVPRVIRDAVYDGVARVRKRIFKTPAAACPMVPDELRPRFLP